MKIINEHCTSYRISKDFTIELDDKTELEVSKWIVDSDDETDSDYDFSADNKKIFDGLSEEEQEKVLDFINDIRL